MTVSNKGKLIVAVGLPCSGKSSVMAGVAALIGAQAFLEPEEHEWGAAVRNWERCCHFTGLMWFRSARVPLLYEAARIRELGGVAIVDSYYDKLIASYLKRPGMEWLLSPDDSYFDIAMEIALTDWKVLPDADCIVSFQVDQPTWRAMLNSRNRALDRDELFAKSFATQSYIHEAASHLAAERGTRLVTYHQHYATEDQAAKLLLAMLRREGVLP